jgi:hypothetical protein
MTTKQYRRSVRCALAAVCLGVMISSATASSFARGCAARDMQILMLIEERESANTISAQKRTDAMHTMMHARTVCHEGRLADALALYDTVAQSLAVDSALPGRLR